MIELRTTAINNFEATRIARALVESNKATSVHVRNICSFYKCDSEAIQTTEFELSIMTTESNINDIINMIKRVIGDDLHDVFIYKQEKG